MNVQIRQGTFGDVDAIAQLYDDVVDYLNETTNYPGWRKGIYPAREDAVSGVSSGDLYVATQGDAIVATIILRPRPEPAYLPVRWQVELDYSQVLVIHTFAVSPRVRNMGLGVRMLEFAEQHAKENSVRALRLDVYEKNLPAMKLYEKCGYRYIDTVSLGMEQYGLDWFKLYEKLL